MDFLHFLPLQRQGLPLTAGTRTLRLPPANKVTSIAEGTTGNTTLYAKWTAKVTFDPRNGGSTIESDPITYNGTAASVKPANPTKTHASFVGWYTGTESGDTVTYSSEYSFMSAVTENITLYAKWDSTEITWVSPAGMSFLQYTTECLF